jgi:DNA-binding NarL/FixJ family response regulator
VPPPQGRGPIPASAYNVAAQLLAVESGIDDHQPMARLHLTGGLWVTLRAARIDARHDGAAPDLAVTIEETTPADRIGVFTRAWGLTTRERELVEHLVDGSDTRAVAGRMCVSEHTVQDHLKAVFAKTGARTRRTLLARCLGT